MIALYIIIAFSTVILCIYFFYYINVAVTQKTKQPSNTELSNCFNSLTDDELNVIFNTISGVDKKSNKIAKLKHNAS